MKNSGLVLFLIFQLLFFQKSDAEESIRCNGSLIDIGELISTVLHKCGDPADSVNYTINSVIHQRYTLSSVTKKYVLVDEFYVEEDSLHNSGNTHKDIKDEEMRRILTDVSGKYREPDNLEFTYQKYKIRRKIRNNELARSIGTQYAYWESQQIENKIRQLVYNPGPYQFVRILTFKNGILWKIEFKEYGY